MLAWVAGLIPRKALLWAAAVAAAIGAIWVALARRDARVAETVRGQITSATQRRELEERRRADEIEDAVAGRSPDDNRRRLGLWSRR